jgi:hypothetical protein
MSEDVDSQRQMLVEHLDVAGVLPRREGVELPADRIVAAQCSAERVSCP